MTHRSLGVTLSYVFGRTLASEHILLDDLLEIVPTFMVLFLLPISYSLADRIAVGKRKITIKVTYKLCPASAVKQLEEVFIA